jgi:hypothetical protein
MPVGSVMATHATLTAATAIGRSRVECRGTRRRRRGTIKKRKQGCASSLAPTRE